MPRTQAETAPSAEAAQPDFGGLDLDLASFDLETTGKIAKPASAPAPAPSSAVEATGGGQTGSFDLGDDLLVQTAAPAGEGQADTRLDLARAYIDMGEPAMAQSLLQEVIAHGDKTQKQEAQELLKRVSG